MTVSSRMVSLFLCPNHSPNVAVSNSFSCKIPGRFNVLSLDRWAKAGKLLVGYANKQTVLRFSLYLDHLEGLQVSL